MKRRLASIGMVAALSLAGVAFGAGEALAQPSCQSSRSANNNSFAVKCTSGPGTRFVALIRCSDRPSVTLAGPERLYTSGQYSAIGCPLNTNATLTFTGVGTR